ncbi:MAG: hypothetical protein LBL06_03805 [Treponema sp.]|nr:hypothetical protein [Treponema sp.]
MLILCIAMTLFASCGLEDYLYLYPVPLSNITVQLNSRATIRLPSSDNYDSVSNFHFTLFYRIYISDMPYDSISTSDYNRLNSTLASDYNALLPYTDTSSTSTTNVSAVGTVFRNRNYYALEFESGNIDSALGSGAGGRTIELDFLQNQGFIPAMNIDATSYRLYRSNGSGNFSPEPDRYFRASDDLTDTAKATSLVNADVVPVSGTPPDRHAYAAFYITASGMDGNFSPVYSAPTFVGVLRLP